MYLVTYEKDENVYWGFADKDNKKIYEAKEVLGQEAPETVLDFIKSVAEYKDISIGDQSSVNMEEVKILPPIKPVRNIFCIGENYLEHIKEFHATKEVRRSAFVHPTFFTKATNAVAGAYDTIFMNKEVTKLVDYEVELAVIIGKRGKDIKENEVMDYIFGYTILNDVSARDLQKNHNQWFKGKSLDGFCPIGPWIVTKDEIEDPQNLKISSRVNGEIRQNSNTSNMIFEIKKLISILSEGMTLEPGDIIATGTPEGVGLGFTPPKLLKKGHIVRCEIEKIGYIENKFE